MQDLAKKLVDGSEPLPCGIEIHTTDGQRAVLGDGMPVVSVYVRNQRGERAVRRLSLLGICEAYIRGDIDLEGDLIEAASFRTRLSDREIAIKVWRRLKPLVVGREQCNREWIGHAYDRHNIQLISADEEFHTYTPGIYESDSESLEVGARRKLQVAFDGLALQAGDDLLDVGCGWGGFLRFCTARQVRVNGITLSRHQLTFVQNLIDREGLEASALYQDFFSFTPNRHYDGISLMGVLEDLSDYHAVMKRLAKWVKPGGRVYLDFAASKERCGTSSFITKYIWPGVFRMVYLPELIEAVWQSPFEIMTLHNDRSNYYRWAREIYRRWMARKAEVLEQADEAVWRTFRIMHAGTANIMRDATCGVSAYRMVLELPRPAAKGEAQEHGQPVRWAHV
jgi:cyclopropane-fatty-acyl-phospholipid synthase